MKRMVYLKNVTTLRFQEERCTGCGMCLTVCPHEVLIPNNGKVRVQNRDACMECGACSRNCPTGAVTVRSGVGCAAGVINTALGRKKDSCCCVIEEKDSSAGSEKEGVTCC
ncbi:MAG: 4Fe-4S binding protein [Proteobacteria bacterium]|nr:4Fe-4S binding protein [Pseudomonadota bacterium]